MRLRPVLPLVAATALSACRTLPAVDSEPLRLGVEAVWVADRPEPRRPSARRPGACATLSDAEGPDVLRVVSDQALALYADRQAGLAIVDIADPDEPKVVATSPFTGEPVGVFEVGGAAVVVYEPWDQPPETIVRAVEIGRRDAGRVLGESRLEGAPRDARRAGDAVVVTRDLPAAEGTAVSTFVVGDDGLTKRDEAHLRGAGAVVGGSPWGVAVAREADRSFGNDRSEVTWLSIHDETAALSTGATVVVGGVVPRWRRGTDHVVDVTEDARVRVVACTTVRCSPGGSATYTAIDFADPGRPRTVSSTTVARAAGAAFNFSGERLFVARPPSDPRARDLTELAVFKTTRDLELLGAVSLAGTVSSLALRADHAMALGWTGTATAGRRAMIHDVDVKHAPKLVGSAVFGGDWTWSAAYDDDRAISLDPSSTLGALPMTTLRGAGGPTSAVQVLSFSSSGPSAVSEIAADAADRLLFVDGRLVSFSGEGVTVVTFPGERRPRLRWEGVGSAVR